MQWDSIEQFLLDRVVLIHLALLLGYNYMLEAGSGESNLQEGSVGCFTIVFDIKANRIINRCIKTALMHRPNMFIFFRL